MILGTAAALLLALPLASMAVNLNEIRIDQPGSDASEYAELAGTAGESLDGITYLVIGDNAGGSGGVDNVTDLTGNVIPADGLFLMAESTFGTGGLGLTGSVDFTTSLNFENSDNVTHMLVTGMNPAVSSSSDLDTDNDGVIDPTGDWDGDGLDDGPAFQSIIDCVGLVETVGTGDLLYCGTLVGPDGTFVPGHVYLCTSGWVIGPFGGGEDTPGVNNNCPVPVQESTWGAIKSRHN